MVTISDVDLQKAVDDLGGLEYLMLLQQSPQTQNIKIFIEGVMQAYIRRCILATCEVIKEDMIKNEKDDIDTILGEINQKMNDITLEFVKENETQNYTIQCLRYVHTIYQSQTENHGNTYSCLLLCSLSFFQLILPLSPPFKVYPVTNTIINNKNRNVKIFLSQSFAKCHISF